MVMLCIYHCSRMDWVLTRVGLIRLCLPGLSMSHAHAKILLQNCYHKVALDALLQNCFDADYSVALARWRYHLCYNNHRKICHLLNTSAWGRAWAEVLDGMPQELENLLSDITSRQRVMWFGDDQPGLSRHLELSRLCFEMWPNVAWCRTKCYVRLCAEMQDKMLCVCFVGEGWGSLGRIWGSCLRPWINKSLTKNTIKQYTSWWMKTLLNYAYNPYVCMHAYSCCSSS